MLYAYSERGYSKAKIRGDEYDNNTETILPLNVTDFDDDLVVR